MDEPFSNAKMLNIIARTHLLAVDMQLAFIRRLKSIVVKKHQYLKAAQLRDFEKSHEQAFERLKSI